MARRQSCPVAQPGEPVQVQLASLDHDQVARRARDQPLAGLDISVLAELLDIPLQCRPRARRGRVVPQRVNQRLCRHDPVSLQQQNGQQRTLLGRKHHKGKLPPRP